MELMKLIQLYRCLISLCGIGTVPAQVHPEGVQQKKEVKQISTFSNKDFIKPEKSFKKQRGDRT